MSSWGSHPMSSSSLSVASAPAVLVRRPIFPPFDARLLNPVPDHPKHNRFQVVPVPIVVPVDPVVDATAPNPSWNPCWMWFVWSERQISCWAMAVIQRRTARPDPNAHGVVVDDVHGVSVGHSVAMRGIDADGDCVKNRSPTRSKSMVEGKKEQEDVIVRKRRVHRTLTPESTEIEKYCYIYIYRTTYHHNTNPSKETEGGVDVGNILRISRRNECQT